MTARRDMPGPERATFLHTDLLAALTIAVLALLEIRAHFIPSLARGYLVWNLFLAWIPYVCGRLIWRTGRGSIPLLLLLPLLAIWLVFLPNAPYLITDVVHFHRDYVGFQLVIESALFATVGVAGLLLGVAAVQPVHRIVAVRYGALAARAFPPLIAVAVAFGVYLGRVQRWNSWSFVESPRRLFEESWQLLVHPLAHPRAFGGIALFSFAFLLVYSVLTTERAALGRPQRQP